ncbi:LPS-assembly protein LptD [Oceanicaulis sp.]|uniref:LPS-assembly protein LptD n=1 Tax=Oceanicaulis sp. TaxID=1924941 RepID=UPI003F71ACFD
MNALYRSAALAALLAAASPAAMAQTVSSDRVYLDADELIQDQQQGLYIARGDVRLQSGDRVLFAQELIYNPTLNRVVASGGVQIFDGSEPAQFAEEVELSDDLREGVARGFATLLENNGRAAAGAALRRPDGSVELSNAYYTACELCETGEGEPTWRLRASRVVRDTQNKVIYYRNVRLEILGRPILYSPVFAHADPSAARQSGFLFPVLNSSSRLGFTYQQPYLWAIGPSQELIVSPRYMGKVNPLLQLDWSRRFYSGEMNVQTSFTYEQEFDQDGKFGDEELRGHVFADGLFRFNQNFRWGFGVEAVSGDLYLRRYGFEESPDRADGLFEIRDQRMLLNQVFFIGDGEHFHGDATVIHFNKLQENVDDDTLPLISPLIRFGAELPMPRWAGDLDFSFNTANLQRNTGDDYTRASLALDWTRPTILPGGVRAEAFALARADAYAFNETDASGNEIDSTNLTRSLGAAGLDLSLPFVRPGENVNWLIAPRMAAIIASSDNADRTPVNVDSASIEFQQSQLFDAARANGYDLWEDGARLDVGLTVAADWRGGLPGELEVFAGRSFRLDGDQRFPASSGLADDDSDWIGQIELDLGQFELDARARIDSESQEINRLDLTAGFDAWRVSMNTRYTRRTDAASTRQLEEVTASAGFAITEDWSVVYDGVIDLEENEIRRQRAGLQYRDECTSLRILWERDNIDVANLGPSDSVKLEIVLFTLGGLSDD